ncbi:olfactory receptor [Sarotherodon galilaeus]
MLFDISAKHAEIFKEFVQFTDSDSEDTPILYNQVAQLADLHKQGAQPVGCTAGQYEDVEKPDKVKMLAEHLTSKKTKFFFLFQVLKPLAEFKVMFQAEGVMFHRLHKEMTSLVRRFMGRFLPASLIADVPLKHIKFMDASLQLPDKELFLAVAAQSLWGDNMDEHSSSVTMMIP